MVTNTRRIQAYVSLSTYESLKSMARDREISLSGLVGEILQAHSIANGSSSSDFYVTRDDLALMLEDFRGWVISEINDLKVKDVTLSKSENIHNSSSRSQKKRRRKGFAK